MTEKIPGTVSLGAGGEEGALEKRLAGLTTHRMEKSSSNHT